MAHFTHEQEIEIARQCFFPSHIISEFNVQGNENVDSEDFDPGYGCVVKKKEYEPAPLPALATNPDDAERLRYFFMKDEQKASIDDEHLRRHGIITAKFDNDVKAIIIE